MRAYRVAYDGRPFHGFQRQPDVPTVSDALLDGLVELSLVEPGEKTASRPVPDGYAAAGRTDAGVSALAQTIAFDAPAWLTPETFDAVTPDEIVVWAAASVPDEFHATHDALTRRYRYLLAPPEVAVADKQSRVKDAALNRTQTAAAELSGTHDYANLTPDERGTNRTVSIDVTRAGQLLAVKVTADGFPRALVRRIVTLLRGAASDDLSDGRIDRLLDPEPVEGPAGVPPAPPEPLVLADTRYDVTFTPDPAAVERGQAAFRERRRAATAVAGVTGFIASRLEL